MNDNDQLPREGGGVCPWNHPKVLGGMLTEGQTSRYCAKDGGGDGSFTNTRSEYWFSSDQISHELSLYSNFEGRFNFTVGAVYIDGEEPYDWRGYNFGSAEAAWRYTDTSARCEAVIESIYGSNGSLSGGGSLLLRDFPGDPNAKASAAATGLYACPGESAIMNRGAGTNYTANTKGQYGLFSGNVEYKTVGYYANIEFIITDTLRLFGGIRDDEDTKSHLVNDYWYPFGLNAADPVAVGLVWVQDSNGDWVQEEQLSLNYCDNDSGEDCFAMITGWPRGSDSGGFEGKNDVEWGATTWNVGVEYDLTEEAMLYGRVSTGYRAGGFYGYAVMNPPWGMPAEEMTNYEAGLKGLFFDKTVQLELSYFYQDFSAYWVFSSRFRTAEELLTNPDGGPITGELEAIDGTTIQGIELQGAWRFLDAFTLRGYYNWLNAEIGPFKAIYPWGLPGAPADWVQLPWTDSQGNPQTTWFNQSGGEYEYGGNQLPNQPEHKGSVTLAYDTPLPEEWGSLEVLTTYNYTGKKYIELANLETYAIDPYHRWDLRANWRSPSQKWLVTLFAQNVLDQAGLYMWSPREGTDSPWGTVVEPRRIGLSITWRTN